MKIFVKTMLVACALIAPSLAAAQNFPSRQVTVVVPFPPGGTNDLIGRFLAERLKEHWKQTVVVENRPGAGSAIGAAHVTRQKPDGYTLMVVSNSFTTTAAAQKSLPFDAMKDLQPVSLAALGDHYIITGTRVPMPTMKDIQTQAKAQKVFVGTTGVGANPHFAGEMLNEIMGIKMEMVHYQGGAAALTDLGGGRVDINFGTANEAGKGIGTLVAVMSEKRSAAYPNVPTVAEAGFPNGVYPYWVGVFTTAGTPKDLLTQINQDIQTVMNSKEGLAFLTQQGFRPPTKMSSDEFTSLYLSEIKKWTAIADKQGITIK